ncbi:hypothetical protein AURDEDRAFT_164433 [Auricularia subglabra TFB-10046 SS5]|nr:hypothetical protein AURDEDRAFT_164433 [Auricularia subglabra TFB-10046 SS5]
MGLDLQRICDLLHSDKVKERQEGISSVRDAFSRDHVLRNFDDGNGRSWVAIFQALFASVNKERDACLTRGLDRAPTVALNRLESASSAVRWLTERALTLLNRRALKPILAHLQETVEYRNQLFKPVSSNYVAALRVIVSFTPHVENLTQEQWPLLLSLAFAILLGKSLDFNFEDHPNPDSEVEEDEDELDSAPEVESIVGTRKRARAPSVPPVNKRMRRSTQPIQSQEQIDSATVIRALVGSWQLAEGQPLARVLELFRAYFAMFPNDATAHSDMLPALATVLGRVALNSRASMTTFGQAMWVPLLAFWNKKERPAKEALIISLRHLFDFVGLEIDGEDERIAQIDRLTRLVKLIDSDADVRTGVSMLAVDDLRLDLRDPGSGQLRAFETNTFCAAPTFSAANALSWATLELQADALCQIGARTTR